MMLVVMVVVVNMWERLGAGKKSSRLHDTDVGDDVGGGDGKAVTAGICITKAMNRPLTAL